jgi:hypothetical protein
MIPDHAIRVLVAQGYLLLNVGEQYVYAIKDVNGQDRYVLLKYEGGHFLVIST